MKTIIFIPARSGSTRLKNKNIKTFNGEPLIYWTAKIAVKSKHSDKIIFSSECNEKIQNQFFSFCK